MSSDGGATEPSHRPRPARRWYRGARAPVVTVVILALTLTVFGLQLVSNGAVTAALAYYPPFTAQEPWRMLTVSLVHSERSFMHILFNMYSLFVLGPLLETMVGRARFFAIYVLSTMGGSVAVLWLAPSTAVVGASGAIFGLLGAFFVIQRRFGGASIQLVVIIVINLALGFLIPGVSWQAHVGGLVVGGLCAVVLVRTRRRAQQSAQQLGLIGLGVGLIALTVARLTLG